MRIVTGFRHNKTPNWNRAMDMLSQSAKASRINISVYDLPTQEEWIASKPVLLLSLCWKYKALFLADLLNATQEDILWIDGDCIVNKPIDFNKAIGEADIAFTLRDIEDRERTKNPERDGLLNSGVIFIRNNDRSRDFFRKVIGFLSECLYDQEAFNKVVLEANPMLNYGYITVGSTTIRLLNCREYNNFYDDYTFDQAYISHYKGALRVKYTERFNINMQEELWK